MTSSRMPNRDRAQPETTPVVIIGELNVDLIMSGCSRWPRLGAEVNVDSCTMTLGSSSAICAVGLARLGRPVSFVGLVGQDPWGDYCIDVLQGAGVDVRHVAREPAVPTGVTVSLTSPAGRGLVTYPGATAALTPSRLPGRLFAGRRHLHVSSFFLQCGMRSGWRSIVERVRNAGWTVSLDSGCDPDDAWCDDVRELVGLVDVFLPNDTELAGVTGCCDPVHALASLENGHTRTIVKLGAAGCMTLVHGQPVFVAPPPVVSVDTTGAGDSFNAGFLHAWLDHRPLDECLRSGVACGALSTRAPGGTTAQPAAEELAHSLEARW
ncbi:MAG: carbohydrate kinase family protein [Vicinamibacteraceae bacterium]